MFCGCCWLQIFLLPSPVLSLPIYCPWSPILLFLDQLKSSYIGNILAIWRFPEVGVPPQFTSIYRWFFHNHRAFFGYPHGNNPHILFSTLLWRPDFIGGCSGHARKLCPFIETCAAAERRGVGTLRRRCVASSKGTKSYGPLRSMMIHFMDEFNIF